MNVPDRERIESVRPRAGGACALLFAAVVALLVPTWGAAAPRPVKYKKGEGGMGLLAELRLVSGRTGQAAEMAKACLEQTPDDLRCTSVLARAKAAAGQCDEALPLFAAVRPTDEWSERTAVLEGLCHVRLGDHARARAVLDEAVQLKPLSPTARFQRSMLALRDYDLSTVEEDVDALREAKAGGWMPEILEAWRLLQSGDPGVDGWLAEMRLLDVEHQEPNAWFQFAMVDCLRWLDLGDPFAAAEVARLGLRYTQGQTRLVACQAEALRRQGDAHNAWFLLDRPWHRETDSSALDAVAVRALADLGDLEAAEARFAGLAGQPDERLASAWYLARARSDGETMARVEAEWRASVPGFRALADYIPLVEE